MATAYIEFADFDESRLAGGLEGYDLEYEWVVLDARGWLVQ